MEIPQIYGDIKAFAKKTLWTLGLIATVSGCGSTVEYKTSQFFKDLNNDGHVEHIYLMSREKPDGEGKPYNWNDYDLMVDKGKEEGKFESPQLIQRFSKRPLEINFEDITGDGLVDLVYLMSREKPDGEGKPYNWNDYDLMVGENNGDLTFEEPRLIKRFHERPVGLG